MNFTILLTEKCNLQCRYCYEKDFSERKKMNHYTMEKSVEFILEQVKKSKSNYLGITLLGGEPLLNADGVKYFLNRLKKEQSTDLTISFKMTTNGTILNDDILDFLPAIDLLSVSLDGDKTVHDMNRIFPDYKGSFDTVIENINKILDVKPNTAARMTVTKKNVLQLFENISFIIDCGFLNIFPNIDFTDRDWEDSDIEIYLDQMKKVSKLIKKGQSSSIEIPILNSFKEKRRNNGCDGGKNSFAISASGDIYPCSVIMNMKEWKIGNIFEGLELSSLERLDEISKTNLSSCDGCSRYEYCNGPRCRLINYKYTGNYNKPLDAFCIYENLSYQLAREQ